MKETIRKVPRAKANEIGLSGHGWLVVAQSSIYGVLCRGLPAMQIGTQLEPLAKLSNAIGRDHQEDQG